MPPPPAVVCTPEARPCPRREGRAQRASDSRDPPDAAAAPASADVCGSTSPTPYNNGEAVCIEDASASRLLSGCGVAARSGLPFECPAAAAAAVELDHSPDSAEDLAVLLTVECGEHAGVVGDRGDLWS